MSSCLKDIPKLLSHPLWAIYDDPKHQSDHAESLIHSLIWTARPLSPGCSLPKSFWQVLNTVSHRCRADVDVDLLRMPGQAKPSQSKPSQSKPGPSHWRARHLKLMDELLLLLWLFWSGLVLALIQILILMLILVLWQCVNFKLLPKATSSPKDTDS